MNNAFFNVVRLSYTVTVAVCAVISLAAAGRLLKSTLAGYGDFFTSAVIALFLLPCLKIFVRKLRGGALLPRPEEGGTRAYLIAITLTGLLGHFLFAVLASAYIEIRAKHLSDVSGIGAVMIVTAALYLLTLWVGEVVVSTSGQPGEKGSGPLGSMPPA